MQLPLTNRPDWWWREHPPAPDVFDAEGEEPSASEAELALEKYGDKLLILSTCEYTYKNGRFVVVAKKVD